MLRKLFFQFPKDPVPVGSRLIHLINKQKCGDIIATQQPPKGFHMALDPIRTADDKHRRIQYLQSPLHLRRKIHMARSIEKGHIPISQLKLRLFGKYGDPSRLFQRIRVQKGVSMIYPPRFSDTAGQIKNALRKSCLASIHMGQKADTDMGFCSCSLLSAHENASSRDCIIEALYHKKRQ